MVLTSAMAAWGKDKLHKIPSEELKSPLPTANPLKKDNRQKQQIIALRDNEEVNPAAPDNVMLWFNVRFS